MSGWCVEFCIEVSLWLSLLHYVALCSSVSVFSIRCHSISDVDPQCSQWLQAPSDAQLSGHVHVGCCLNPLLSPRPFLHLPVSRQSPFALMGDKTKLTCHEFFNSALNAVASMPGKNRMVYLLLVCRRAASLKDAAIPASSFTSWKTRQTEFFSASLWFSVLSVHLDH